MLVRNTQPSYVIIEWRQREEEETRVPPADEDAARRESLDRPSLITGKTGARARLVGRHAEKSHAERNSTMT